MARCARPEVVSLWNTSYGQGVLDQRWYHYGTLAVARCARPEVVSLWNTSCGQSVLDQRWYFRKMLNNLRAVDQYILC